jgi:uncharacterized protein (TIGR02145 family)
MYINIRLSLANITFVVLFALSCSSDNENYDCLDNGDCYDPEIAYCDGIEYNFYSHYCSSGEVIAKEEFADSRDEQKYRYVIIGSQTWMAENLNYTDSDGSIGVCYDNNFNNCNIFGRLYNWYEAISICPSGWHLPNNAEWENLMRYVDGNTGTDNVYGNYESPTAGKHLKAKSGWYWHGCNNNCGLSGLGNGEDTFGFTSLPGGYCSLHGNFDFVYERACWWSASDMTDKDYAYYRANSYNFESMGLGHSNPKNNMLSVRCLKD